MANVEALWSVRFGQDDHDPSEYEGGALTFAAGRLFGGDSAYAYQGEYALDGGRISGKMTIILHNPGPSYANLYGAQEPQFALTFSGDRLDENRIEGWLHRDGHPDARLLLRRLADLP